MENKPDEQPQDVTLTTRQGHPISNNQSSRTVGSRGPATLENYQFLEKISHFDRERTPERVVHARGFVAYGEFEATGQIGDEPASKYTRAKLFQAAGKKTPMVIRFSTVIGGPRFVRSGARSARVRGEVLHRGRQLGPSWATTCRCSSSATRSSSRMSSIRSSPTRVTFRQEANRIFDFMSQTPEAQHMLTFLFSPRGIPKSYRHQEGYGVNTYKMVNADGQTVIVKYHFHPHEGVHSFVESEAKKVQGEDLGSASKDLFDAIKKGNFPEVGHVSCS